MASSPRPPPPAYIGLGPPVAGAVLLILRGPPSMKAWWALGAGVVVVGLLETVATLARGREAVRPERKPLTDAVVGMARLVSVAGASLAAMIGVAVGLGELQTVPLMVVAGLLMVVMAVGLGVQRVSAARRALRSR